MLDRAQNYMGRHDIYYMDIYSVDNPRMYLVTGSLRTEAETIRNRKEK